METGGAEYAYALHGELGDTFVRPGSSESRIPVSRMRRGWIGSAQCAVYVTLASRRPVSRSVSASASLTFMLVKTICRKTNRPPYIASTYTAGLPFIYPRRPYAALERMTIDVFVKFTAPAFSNMRRGELASPVWREAATGMSKLPPWRMKYIPVMGAKTFL